MHESINVLLNLSTGDFLAQPGDAHYSAWLSAVRRSWFNDLSVIGDHAGLRTLLERKAMVWSADCDAAKFYGALRLHPTLEALFGRPTSALTRFFKGLL